MVAICCEKLVNADMKLNVKKSQVVRIGKSHRNAVNDVIGGKPVDYGMS